MISEIELQSNTAQDMVRTGDDWMVVCDGHGGGKVVNLLRVLNWDVVVRHDDPSEFLNETVHTLGDTVGDGATFSMVRTTDDGIDCTWMGDSQIRLYADETEVWRSGNHNHENPDEVDRHLNRGGETSNSWTVKVLDKDTVTMEPSYYFEFDRQERLAMTRALGHNDLYMPQVERQFIAFSEFPGAKHWKVVVGTDGVWDMICEADDALLGSPEADAKTLGDLAVSRWNQRWDYKHPPPHTSISSGELIASQRDDVGVVVWQK